MTFDEWWERLPKDALPFEWDKVLREVARLAWHVSRENPPPAPSGQVGSPEYQDDGHCDHCDRITTHRVRDSGHERDSSYDTRTCLECGWVWTGMSGEYEPPATGE